VTCPCQPPAARGDSSSISRATIVPCTSPAPAASPRSSHAAGRIATSFTTTAETRLLSIFPIGRPGALLRTQNSQSPRPARIRYRPRRLPGQCHHRPGVKVCVVDTKSTTPPRPAKQGRQRSTLCRHR
jgi:hypothetical protein